MSVRRGSARMLRVAQRARAELHPPLEPADDPAVGQLARRAVDQLIVVEPACTRGRSRLSSRSISASLYSRPVVDVAHHEAARPLQDLVPDVQRRADRRAGVVRRRLDVDVLERRAIEDHAVGDAVERDAAGQADLLEPGALVDGVEQREVALFEHQLNRRRQIRVPLLERALRARARGRTRSIIFGE